MPLFIVVHHPNDASQPWINAWLSDGEIEAIQTTREIGGLCGNAKSNGERVLVHRCAWGDFPPVVCCSVEISSVDRIDKSTSLVRFTAPIRLDRRPIILPNKGQNFYMAPDV